MGAGSAGSTGSSEDREEKKVDSYSKQFRKNYKITNDGKVKERNTFEKALINSPGGKVVSSVADNLNYKRRLKFAEDKGLNLLSKSEEYILSPAGKAYLDEFGYQKTLEGPKPNNDNGNDNNQPPPPQETIVKKNIGGSKVQTTEEKLAEEKAKDDEYDVRKVKKKGRKRYTLTSSKGVTQVSDDYSLGKKSLLGTV